MQPTEYGRAFVQSKQYEIAIKMLAALNRDDEIYVYTAVALCMNAEGTTAEDDEIAAFINEHKHEIKLVADAALSKGKVKKQNPNTGLWQDYVSLF